MPVVPVSMTVRHNVPLQKLKVALGGVSDSVVIFTSQYPAALLTGALHGSWRSWSRQGPTHWEPPQPPKMPHCHNTWDGSVEV